MRSWLRVLIVTVAGGLLAGCWPMPGAGPDRRSFNSSEQRLTADTVDRLTEVFRIPLPAGAGPPIVTNLGLFVRTGRSIAAFEPRSGAARWSVPLAEDSPTRPPSISDPYVVIDDDEVLATATTFGPSNERDDRLVTLDPATGAQRRTPSSGALGSLRRVTAAVVGRDQCCGGVDVTRIATISPSDRSWGGVAPEAVDGVPTLGSGRLYLATQDRVLAYDTRGPCLPLRPGDARRICQTEWARSIGSSVTAVVIGDRSAVYVGSAGGRVYALRATAGGILWSAGLGSGVTVAPALAYDTVYVTTDDGRLSAVGAFGCETMECPVAWTTATGSAGTVQPAVAGRVVFTGAADGTVSAFDASGCGAATCAPLWTVDTGAPVTGGLAVSSGRLYVGTEDGVVSYGLAPD